MVASLGCSNADRKRQIKEESLRVLTLGDADGSCAAGDQRAMTVCVRQMDETKTPFNHTIAPKVLARDPPNR